MANKAGSYKRITRAMINDAIAKVEALELKNQDKIHFEYVDYVASTGGVASIEDACAVASGRAVYEIKAECVAILKELLD